MSSSIRTVSLRTAGEWELHSSHPYANPFADVTVDGTFTSPSGRAYTIPAFYDGEATWRLRFSPGESGRWTYRTCSRPSDPDLAREGSFEVEPGPGRPFLQATPGRAWGFHDETGEPVFLLGDTVYNLFGMAYCGVDVQSFLERRARQGFNLLRVRLPVSPFHPPEGYSTWQTRRTWPWGGSEQAPCFDRFNLDYFRTVDQVVGMAERLGLGLEMIMEAWGFEFPFNSRHIFTAEWEELWLRYLIARYDAFSCVYFWTPLNEYEFYPNGDWHYKPLADRWAMRIGRWIKGVAPHGHIVSVHNGPREPAFAQRFAADPEAIDAIMFQHWGTTGEQDAWLAAGIEGQIARSLAGWWGSAVFAEYGYERNPELPLVFPGHAYCDPEHTRRGAWRGAFCALGVIHGFENSWGPFQVLDQDQPGLAYLLHMRRFFSEIVPFHRVRPAPDTIVSREAAPGRRPMALASEGRELAVVYLPVGGEIDLALPASLRYDVRWFDPRTGELHPARACEGEPRWRFLAPGSEAAHPPDWLLVLSAANGAG